MGLLDVFKAIGRGYDRAATGGLSALVPGGVQPGELTQEQRAYLRGALLSSLGSIFTTMGSPGSGLPMLTSMSAPIAEPIVQRRNQEALQNALGQTNSNIERAMIAERLGNKALAKYYADLATMDARKNLPKGAPIQALDAQGRPIYVQPTEGGGLNPLPEYRPPVKPETIDTGGSVARIDPYTGQVVGNLQKTITPDAQARLAQAASQFEQTLEIQKKQLENDNARLVEARIKRLSNEAIANRQLSLGWARLEDDRIDRELRKNSQMLTALRDVKKDIDNLNGFDLTLETIDKMKNYLTTKGLPLPFSTDAAVFSAWSKSVIDSYRLAKGYGALQEAEIKFLDKMFPDPTNFMNYLRGKAIGKGVFIQPLEEISAILARARDRIALQKDLVRAPNGKYVPTGFAQQFLNQAAPQPAARPQTRLRYNPVTGRLEVVE